MRHGGRRARVQLFAVVEVTALRPRIATADLAQLGVEHAPAIVALIESAQTPAERFGRALRTLRPLGFTRAGIWELLAEHGYVANDDRRSESAEVTNA